MKIDYEYAFKTLLKQIRTEYYWANEDEDTPIDRKRGMIFAYGSMLEVAEDLATGARFEDEEDMDDNELY